MKLKKVIEKYEQRIMQLEKSRYRNLSNGIEYLVNKRYVQLDILNEVLKDLKEMKTKK